MFAEFDWVEATRSSPILIALLLASVVTLAVSIERTLYYRRRSGDTQQLLLRVIDLVGKGKISEAVAALGQTTHPFGRVAADVISGDNHSTIASEERLQIGLSNQKLQLEKHLSILGSMAAVAPLVGLLGTVWGIMRAFHDMAQVGSAAPSVVAAGVAEALLTTAAGLVVAVPAVLLYNHFTRRMSVMLIVAENQTRAIRNVLVEHSGPVSVVNEAEVEKISSAIRNQPSQPVPTIQT